ncbi:MAG: diguanylate cyclase [Gallionella sp.]
MAGLRWMALLSCLVAGQACALEKVTLQLKWMHAFQFAGYYAALEQGYYRDAGLNVDIVAATTHTDPVSNVLDGRAQYGIGTSNLLLERAAGKPVVVLAVVFQQSPYEIYAAPEIHTLHDLIGKRIMLEPQSGELLAYLKKAGIPLNKIKKIPHSFDANSLMKGDVEAMSGYLSNEPFYFRKANYPYQTFSPHSLGIDFYGDNLFTSERELQSHPARVKAFRAASLRGWKYAKEHRDQVISLILNKYSTSHTREYLQFESDHMIPLLQPNLIEIGYMNPDRWRAIANTYADIGLLPKNFPLDNFLYDVIELDMKWLYRDLFAALFLMLGVFVVALYILRTNRSLKLNLIKLSDTQQALAKSEQHYRLLIENMRDVVWILDPYTFRYHYVSPSVERLRGYTVEEVMCTSMDALLTPKYAKALKEKRQGYLDAFLSGNAAEKVYVEEFQQLHKNGRAVWVEATATYYRNEETGRVEIHGVTRDITERKAVQDAIQLRAMHDLLTGLPSRKLLSDRVQQAFFAAKRDHKQAALMFVDLDRFKPVNDTLGHDVGDRLLKWVADRLLACVRESDTVARVGGDEFIVLLRTIESTDEAMRIAEKIRTALDLPFELDDDRLKISCSVGVALYPEHGEDEIVLTKHADVAMYRAKTQGRNKVQLFTPDT